MACAAIAGSIRAGCLTDSGTYRPRRCEGPADCAVTHTDSPSGAGATRSGPSSPRFAAPIGLVGSLGPGAPRSVVRLATDTTTTRTRARTRGRRGAGPGRGGGPGGGGGAGGGRGGVGRVTAEPPGDPRRLGLSATPPPRPAVRAAGAVRDRCGAWGGRADHQRRRVGEPALVVPAPTGGGRGGEGVVLSQVDHGLARPAVGGVQPVGQPRGDGCLAHPGRGAPDRQGYRRLTGNHIDRVGADLLGRRVLGCVCTSGHGGCTPGRREATTLTPTNPSQSSPA